MISTSLTALLTLTVIIENRQTSNLTALQTISAIYEDLKDFCSSKVLQGIERFHVTSQSHENQTGGHFGVQLNGALVCCTMLLQNAVQTRQLTDLPRKYVRYRYLVHVICET